jgi:glucose/arabinose dehydrogenase
MNSDGSIPQDNPYPNSYIYSYGHRNPQGIGWNQHSKMMYETEHGPSGFDGPGGGDEINYIKAGANYGWPIVSHEKSKDGMISPIQVYTPAVAPASVLIYSGKVFPQFKDHLFFGALKGTGLYHVSFDESGMKMSSQEKLPTIDVGRIRDVVEGPDGFIYFSTSNTDGRGNPNKADDKIYRLVPSR